MSQVRIANKLSQTVSVSLTGPSGAVEELKIAAKATSEPVDEGTLTDHTLGLVRLGHLRLRPVSA